MSSGTDTIAAQDTFFFAKYEDESRRRFPQTIAHRGFKAEHPENSMGAFAGAVKAGAHAIETDIHLSKDGVIVLSHDPTLERCFGRPEKIIDCDWEYLSSLKTLREPHEGMPRLKDLLEYLILPGAEHIWVLFDIKLFNNPDMAPEIMKALAKTVEEAPVSSRPWRERLVVGCWAAKYISLCQEHFPGYPLTHIGFTPLYARQFLKVPGMSFNMLQSTLIGPFGQLLIRAIKKRHRALFVWTVNSENGMRWCIKKQVDGVVTDNPRKFREICESWEGQEGLQLFTFREYMSMLWLNVLALTYGSLQRYKFKMGLLPWSWKEVTSSEVRKDI